MKTTTILSILIATFLIVGCKKLVEVGTPLTKFDASKVYNKDQNAIAVITSLYQEMSADGFAQGTNGLSIFAGLSSDELLDYPGFSDQRTAAYQNRLTPQIVPLWGRLWFFVYTTNTAIQGITESPTLTPVVKQRLLGESKFMRAFCYLILVNLWGDVPLMTSNDYEVNRIATRSSTDLIYKQIITDLKEAEGLLSTEYVVSDLKTETEERIRPNKWAAKALLARAYLYAKDYTNAELKASEIIDQHDLFSLEKTGEVFLNSSREAIWQIRPTNPFWNTLDATAFVLTGTPTVSQPVSLSTEIVNSFEPGDNRFTEWVGSITVGSETYYYPFKYKAYIENSPQMESLMVLRLGEQFLIRAEARTNLGKIPDAIGDINIIRSRARSVPTVDVPTPLPDLSSTLSGEAVDTAIQQERKVELFTEWGHRWFDLKRTGKLNATMESIASRKGIVWDSNMSLYPIPADELTRNYNMTQNLGY